MKLMTREKLKQIISCYLSTSLVISPTFAQGANTSTNTQNRNNTNNAAAIGGAIQGVGNAINQGMQQYQQMMQQQQEAMRTQQTLQKITPTATFDDFFPQCKMLPAQATHNSGVEDLCRSPLASPSDLQKAQAFNLAARANANSYKQFFETRVKHGGQVGSECVDEGKQRLKQQMEERLNALTNMENQIKQQNEVFQREADQRKNALKDLQAELEGGDGGTVAGKNRDFTNLFSDANCKAVLTKEALNGGSEGGLRGIFKTIEGVGIDKARSVVANERNLEDEIRGVANDIVKQVQDNGFSSLTPESLPIRSSGITSSQSFGIAFGNTQKEIASTRNKVISQIDRFFPGSGESLAKEMRVKSFSFDNFINKIETKKVNDCMETKLGMSPDKFIGNFQQKGVSQTGTSVKYFQQKIAAIMSTANLSMDQKISEIKKLEKEYGNSNFTVQLGSPMGDRGANYDWKASEIFSTFNSQCKMRMENNGDASKDNLSFNEQIKSLKNDYSELQKVEKQSANQIANSVLDRMLNCKGVSYAEIASNAADESPTGCSANKMDTKNANFCLSQAKKCALSIQACHQKADAEIKSRVQKQKLIATDYNKAVDKYRVNQLAMLQKTTQELAAQSQLLKQYFPKAEFKLPEDNFLEFPKATMKPEFGVQLSDTEDFVKSLNTKLAKIKETMKTQNQSIEKNVEDHLAKIKKAYAEEQQYWEKLANDCKSQEDKYNQQMAQQSAEQQKKFGENQEKIKKYCTNLSSMSRGPACKDAAQSLVTSMGDIISQLSPDEVRKIREYKTYCDTFMNQTTSGTEFNAGNVQRQDILSYCKTAEGGAREECKSYLEKYKAACLLNNPIVEETPQTSNTTQLTAAEETALKAELKKLQVISTNYQSIIQYNQLTTQIAAETNATTKTNLQNQQQTLLNDINSRLNGVTLDLATAANGFDNQAAVETKILEIKAKLNPPTQNAQTASAPRTNKCNTYDYDSSALNSVDQPYDLRQLAVDYYKAKKTQGTAVTGESADAKKYYEANIGELSSSVCSAINPSNTVQQASDQFLNNINAPFNPNARHQ